MIFIAARERKKFISALGPENNGLPHKVDRSTIFHSIMELYTQDDYINEFPLRVSFKGENAIDSGVYRDMLSGFWDEAYCRLFDGGSLLTPVLYSETDTSTFTVIGKIKYLKAI